MASTKKATSKAKSTSTPKKPAAKAPATKAAAQKVAPEKKAKKSGLDFKKKYDIIQDGNVYIRTLFGEIAEKFVIKMNLKAAEHAKVVGRKSYKICEAVLTSQNTRFVVRFDVRKKDPETGDMKTVVERKVFTKRQVALDFAHQIPNTPVTLS